MLMNSYHHCEEELKGVGANFLEKFHRFLSREFVEIMKTNESLFTLSWFKSMSMV